MLVGASAQTGTLGHVVMKNLLAGEFTGPILAVNPKYKSILGQICYAHIHELPIVPDLALICTPAATVPGIITELAERGTRAAIVLSAGFDTLENNITLRQKMLDACKPWKFRILGPNCVGMLNPGIGLNASFAHTGSLRGNIALVSQSGAICTSILDWAKSRGVGFSSFISLGDSSDVDVGDVLDYLSTDQHTHSIFLYLESIQDARKFLSAARATSRNKKVIVIKAGRYAEGAQAAASHTGALAGNDQVFEAVVERTGMLRVYTIQNLFDAVETLAHTRPITGNRLAIITNGGGMGVLATDSLIAEGGKLAQLAPETIQALNQCLPAAWSKANPVDIIGDSDAARYEQALNILLQDHNYDAILVILVPIAVIDNTRVASAVTACARNSAKPIFTCWLGGDAVTTAREIFEQAGIPTYETPESAIRAFLQIVEYEQNQTALIETPPSVPEEFDPDIATVKQIMAEALSSKHELLNEHEAKSVLHAYGIPVVKTQFAATIDQAVAIAEDIGYPVVLKIVSPQITHKSDVGGVLLNIESATILSTAAEGLLARVKRIRPDARVEGFTIQKMIEHEDAHELIIGVSTDPVFGPVILFGQGGVSVEIMHDHHLALPPLNLKLARDLIKRTRVYNLLKGYRNVPSADLASVELTLIKISQLIIDHPEIHELDINPLYVNPHGIVALDARIRVKSCAGKPGKHLAIRPYPKHLEENVVLDTGEAILLRPIKPEDEPAHTASMAMSAPEDIYMRFFRSITALSHEQMARFTQIDYDREMAFIAIRNRDTDGYETLGVVRAICDADTIKADLSIIIRSDYKGRGLGSLLIDKMIRYCRDKGLQQITGQVLPENTAMLALAKKFGFESSADLENHVVLISLDLTG